MSFEIPFSPAKWYWGSDNGWAPFSSSVSSLCEKGYITWLCCNGKNTVDVDDERYVEFSDPESISSNFRFIAPTDVDDCIGLQRRKDNRNKRYCSCLHLYLENLLLCILIFYFFILYCCNSGEQ